MDIARSINTLETTSSKLVKLNMLSAGLRSGIVEKYANMLRQNGIAIASASVASIGELEEHLQSSVIDLVLCDDNQAEMPLDSVISAIQQFNTDSALLVTGDSGILEQFKFGITDIVDLDDETHTLHTLNRTIQGILASQKLHDLERQKDSYEKRCQMLMDSSREAICYTHEGMHVFANPSYLELFNISVEDDEIETITLMDLVEPSYHADLKRMLKLSQHANEKEYSLEVGCKRLDESSFTADMIFSPVMVDEERSVQIIVREKTADSPSTMPNIDLLTGLNSSSYFQGNASEIIDMAKESGKRYALFYIAIDRYMQLREAVGLTQSNFIIKELAELLGKTLKSEMSKTLSRIGDHAFAFIAPANEISHVKTVANALIKRVEQHRFDKIQGDRRPAISIGISLSDQQNISDGSDFIDLAYHAYSSVADSDTPVALYGEKAEKEKTEVVQASHTPVASSEDADTIDLVKYALDNNKISHQLVALLNLEAGPEQSSYHVNLLFTDDSGKTTPYESIRDAVHASGKAADIESKTLHKLAEILNRSGNSATVFHVPLSSASFTDSQFTGRLQKLVKHYAISPGNFSFILEGRDIRQHLAEAKKFCTVIQQIGGECCISGFAEREDDLALIRDLAVAGIWYTRKLSANFSQHENKLQRLKDLDNVLKSHQMKTILGDINSPSDLANAWGLGVNFITGPFLHAGSEEPDFDFSRYC